MHFSFISFVSKNINRFSSLKWPNLPLYIGISCGRYASLPSSMFGENLIFDMLYDILNFLQSIIFALALLYQWTKAEKAYTYFHYNKVYFQHLLEENTVCPRRPSLLIGELHLLAWTEQESHACNVNQALDRKQKHFGSHFSELSFYIIIPFRWVLNVMIRIMGMSYIHMSL